MRLPENLDSAKSIFSPYEATARGLWRKYLSFVPLHPREKRPINKGWDELCSRYPVLSEIVEGEIIPNANIGLCCGEASGIVALDFDNFPEIWTEIEKLIPQSPVRKRGSKGYTVFYRYSGEKPKKWKIAKKTVCELLSKGNQTVLPPSIHPSGAVYRYDGQSLTDISVSDLPALPKDFCSSVDRIVSRLKKDPQFVAELIFEEFGGERRGEGYQIHCPCHDDDKPSCSVDVKDGKLLVHCHAGCDVVTTLKQKGLWLEKDKPESTESRLIALNIADFLSYKFAPRVEILSPWLFTQSINMIHSWRGTGKTQVASTIAASVALGRECFGLPWNAKEPKRVIYLDGEMAGEDLQERFGAVWNNEDVDPNYLRILTPDLQEASLPDLSTREGCQKMDDVLQDAELVFVDNISSFCRTGAENEAESWQVILEWLLKLRREGRSTVLVHHSGKLGGQRGTSKREDQLDCVIHLKHPPEYDFSNGCEFELHFEKARRVYGKAVEPFFAKLVSMNGIYHWNFTPLENSLRDAILGLSDEGHSQRQIVKILDRDGFQVSQSKVSRILKSSSLKNDS